MRESVLIEENRPQSAGPVVHSQSVCCGPRRDLGGDGADPLRRMEDAGRTRRWQPGCHVSEDRATSPRRLTRVQSTQSKSLCAASPGVGLQRKTWETSKRETMLKGRCLQFRLPSPEVGGNHQGAPRTVQPQLPPRPAESPRSRPGHPHLKQAPHEIHL